jgi:hypothetical protein
VRSREATRQGGSPKPLLIGKVDCSNLFYRYALEEVQRQSAGTSINAQAVAEVIARSCNIGGEVLYSQARIAAQVATRGRGNRSESENACRQSVNRWLGELEAAGIVTRSMKQRSFLGPKTTRLAVSIMTRVMRLVRRALWRALFCDTSRSKTYVATDQSRNRRIPGGYVSLAGRLVKRKRRWLTLNGQAYRRPRQFNDLFGDYGAGIPSAQVFSERPGVCKRLLAHKIPGRSGRRRPGCTLTTFTDNEV